MKRALRAISVIGVKTVAIFAVQAAVTISLAYMVRPMCGLGYGGADVAGPLVYGIAAVLAFIGFFRFAIKPQLKIRLVFAILTAVVLASFGQVNAIGTMQNLDEWRASRYTVGLRALLHSDSRFKEVQVLGYSDSYVLLPYVPIVGKVATQTDWQALVGIVRASHPPVKADVCISFDLPPDEGSSPPPVRFVHID